MADPTKLSSSGPSEKPDTPPEIEPRPSPSDAKGGIKLILKAVANAIGISLTAILALTCWAERIISDRDAIFLFWGQGLAIVPGLLGIYLRRGYYFLTIRRCSLSCEIGFLTYVHDRRTQIGRRVHIGTGVGLGWVAIGDGCLLASRSSILSGSAQHRLGADGRLTPFDRAAARQVHIGRDSWIGEGAIVMADVADRCIIGAGSIVTRPVPAGSVVAGNPARLIRRLPDNPLPPST